MLQPEQSLRAALIRAQSGYRSDVSALAQSLKESDVFAPLARGVGLRLAGPLPAGTSLVLHNLVSGDGTRWLPLFSSVQALRSAGERSRWTTSGGGLNYVEFKWGDAFDAMFRALLQSGENAGVVFDVGSQSELALMRHEALSIAAGQIVPLVEYAARQPTPPNEQVYVGEPAVAPPEALLQALRGVLASEPLVESYRLRQVFMPERDVMPHLVLDIKSGAPEHERRRISQKVGQILQSVSIPPPGYVDVAFNFSD